MPAWRMRFASRRVKCGEPTQDDIEMCAAAFSPLELRQRAVNQVNGNRSFSHS
jgi:hypothetical protein